eukprot:7619444-Pyramimonas_sp.AAC.1
MRPGEIEKTCRQHGLAHGSDVHALVAASASPSPPTIRSKGATIFFWILRVSQPASPGTIAKGV